MTSGRIAIKGSAYVFVRSGTAWTAQQKLTATQGAAEDFFGLDVSISGDTAVIGASADDVGTNTDQGSAYVFARTGTSWAEQQTLAGDNGSPADFFGFSVAISGNTIVVGASDDDIGGNTDQGSAAIFASEATSAIPTIGSISPATSGAGGASFELTVNGTNFDAGSIVRWNGQDRATTFVSSTQLRAQILASDLQAPGQYPVTVFNPLTGGGLSNAVNFTVTACTYTINPIMTGLAATGGTSSANVTTANGCAWTAVSNVPWITVVSGTGSGSGTFTFTVAPNSGPARSGTISIAGQTFTVNQAGGCVYALSATSTNVPATGGNGSVNVTSGAGCTWTAVSNVPWITITSGSNGSGNGTVSFSVAPNTGIERSGTITIAGQTFTVNQAGGCTYSLSATSASIAPAGGTGSVSVMTGTGCTWTAVSNVPWITITSGRDRNWKRRGSFYGRS
jgi:hypothetical protein